MHTWTSYFDLLCVLVLDLAALQGAPVVDGSGRSTSWLPGHSGGLLCATGSGLTDSKLHDEDREESDESEFLFTGAGDWSICEWELRS